MRIQIPLKPDLENETYLQISINNNNTITVEKLMIDHVYKMRDKEEIYEEKSETSNGYFCNYMRIVDKGKFVVYYPSNGELVVADSANPDLYKKMRIEQLENWNDTDV